MLLDIVVHLSEFWTGFVMGVLVAVIGFIALALTVGDSNR